MGSPESAGFTLVDYRISKVSFEYIPSDSPINIDINPSGYYNKESQEFDLLLDFTATTSESKKDFIKAQMETKFKFKEKINEIPEFFFTNAPAIAFPYLRTFISTITLQANIRLLILPTLNLSPLAEVLKANTTLK
ncbi:hypothetical protein [Ekhidna sp.]|uniref:hypothetical protein n=1 Tax=Ekhidna sp. TaxID=2608089 RepID=UPI0032F03A30